MNDLAEKALYAVNVAQAEIRCRPTLSLGVAGAAVSSGTAIAGARATAARTTHPITPWFGLLRTPGGQHTHLLAGALFMAGVVALTALWLTAVAAARRHGLSEGSIWTIAAAWALPFLLAPPLPDRRIYLDVARGLLQRNGLDPYDDPISRLGAAPILDAVDPSLQGTRAAAGPVALLIQHLSVAASGGHPVGAVVFLRAVGLVGFVLMARAAGDLAGARRRRALTLVALNPLLLLYVLSAGHTDGLAGGLLVSALAFANQRRWARAVLASAVAACIQPVLGIALVVLIAVHALNRRGGPAWAVVGRDASEAGVIIGALSLVRPDGFGWIGNVSSQFGDYVLYAPSNALGRLVEPIVAGASFDTAVIGGRLTASIAATATVCYLMITARHRPLEHSVGYALLAAAVFAPDVRPWSLLWAVGCLAPTVTGLRRELVVILSGTACLLDPPGFPDNATDRISVVVVAVAAVLTVAVVWRSGELRSVPAGDLTDGGADVGEVDGRDDGGDERDRAGRRPYQPSEQG